MFLSFYWKANIIKEIVIKIILILLYVLPNFIRYLCAINIDKNRFRNKPAPAVNRTGITTQTICWLWQIFP